MLIDRTFLALISGSEPPGPLRGLLLLQTRLSSALRCQSSSQSRRGRAREGALTEPFRERAHIFRRSCQRG